jgi:hypothetical protein
MIILAINNNNSTIDQHRNDGMIVKYSKGDIMVIIMIIRGIAMVTIMLPKTIMIVVLNQIVKDNDNKLMIMMITIIIRMTMIMILILIFVIFCNCVRTYGSLFSLGKSWEWHVKTSDNYMRNMGRLSWPELRLQDPRTSFQLISVKRLLYIRMHRLESKWPLAGFGIDHHFKTSGCRPCFAKTIQ